MTRERAIENSALVRDACPLVYDATLNIAHLPIRSRGTIGGSISNADPAAEYPATMLALGAVMIAKSGRGERSIPAAEFFEGVLSTTLNSDEILTEIRVPKAPADSGSAFVEICRRHGDYALAGVGAQVKMDGDSVEDVQLAACGVGPGPVRLTEAESVLRDNSLTDEILSQAEQAASAQVDPDGDAYASAAYRRKLAGVMTKRAVQQAAGRAGEWRMTDRTSVTITVNGISLTGLAEPRMLLADFLRDELRLTGTHVGCEHGVCGACTVIVDSVAARSCLMFAVQADGAEIRTIEGLATDGEMHPLQKLFSEHRALQCGFCTPGMLMTAIDLVNSTDGLTEEDIRIGMSAALCRCTGYEGIVNAVAEYAGNVHGKGGVR